MGAVRRVARVDVTRGPLHTQARVVRASGDAMWWERCPCKSRSDARCSRSAQFVPGSHYQLYRSGYDAIGYFASLASGGAQASPLRADEAAASSRSSTLAHRIKCSRSLGWNAGAPSTVASAAARQPWSPAWSIHDPALQTDLGAGRVCACHRQRAPINMAARIDHTLQEGEMALLEATCADKPLVKITASGAGRVRVGEVEEQFWSPRFETFVCRTVRARAPTVDRWSLPRTPRPTLSTASLCWPRAPRRT